MGPKFSVVVNTTGRSRFIKSTLDSIRGQLFRDFEVIIYFNRLDSWVDVDNIRPLICEFDYRFRLIEGPGHESLGSARNSALDYCSGCWISFLDDDDTWLPQRLEEYAREIDLNLASSGCFYISDYVNVDENGSILKNVTSGEIETYRKWPCADFVINYPVGWTTCCFPSSIFEKVRFNSKLEFIADFWLVFDVMDHLKPIRLSKVLSCYRVHGASLSGRRLDLCANDFDLFLSENGHRFTYLEQLILLGYIGSRRRIKKLGSLLLGGDRLRRLKLVFGLVLFGFIRLVNKVKK